MLAVYEAAVRFPEFPPSPGLFIADGARLGGAIIAASGSFGVSCFGIFMLGPVSDPGLGVIGGGARGLATSSGSSPGNIHPAK